MVAARGCWRGTTSRAARGLVWAVVFACAGGGVRSARAEEKTGTGEQPFRFAAAVESGEVAALLRPILARHGVPALGAALVQRGKPTEIACVGSRRFGGAQAVTWQDRWHLGSCSKALTATLLARLEETKRIAAPVDLLAAFPRVGVHAGWRAFTLERLLAHVSGLPAAYPPPLWAWCWNGGASGREQRARLVGEMLAAAPPKGATPGFQYANMNFDIVGAALEHALDEEFEAIAKLHLFAPLGLERAGFGAPGAADDGVAEPRGHRARDSSWEAVEPGRGADNPEALSPAGRMHMSLADWARCAEVHLAPPEPRGGTEANPPRYLSAERLARMHAPAAGESYTHGWGIAKRAWSKGPVLTHAGSNTMWFVVAWLAPAEGLGVLVVCNAAGKAPEAAADEVASQLIGRARR